MIATIEITAFWVTVGAYVVAFCVQFFSTVRPNARGLAGAFWMVWLGIACHTAAIILRWLDSGHIPVTDTYELNLVGTWFTIVLFMLFERAGKVDRSIGLVVVPIAFLVLGHGFIERDAALPMGPAFRSPWLVVHVIFAWLAFGCFAIACGAGVLFLLKERCGQRPIAGRLPSLEALDLAGYRYVVLGFVNHAIMLAAGTIWAKMLWGRYWGWDPLEIWSLLVFLFYAFYLHARAFLGWKMRRAAWLAAFGLIVLSISFWGVEWFAPSLHPGP